MEIYEPIDKPFCLDIVQKDETIAVIGDVHGCLDEVVSLVELLDETYSSNLRIIFIGDLIDRGPKSLGTIAFAEGCNQLNTGQIIIGNHDRKLLRYCQGKQVQIHGEQEWFKDLGESDKDIILSYYKESPTAIRYKLLSGKTLVIAHGAAPSVMYNPLNTIREEEPCYWYLSNKDACVCYYGHTTGKRTEDGYPERLHRPTPDKDHISIFGHIVHDINHCRADNEPGTSIYIDHGGCFGYWLSAIVFKPDFSEPDIISVPSKMYIDNDPTRMTKLMVL